MQHVAYIVTKFVPVVKSHCEVPVQSVERAVKALKLMADQGSDVSVSQTARHLGVTRSTASRILASLARDGLIEQNPATQRYQPGILSLRLASSFGRNIDLVAQGETALKRLSETTGHTSWLGLLSGAEVVVLKTFRGSFPIHFSVEPGQRLPAHAAALGKALLALLDDAEVRALYGRGLRASTGRTITAIEPLLRELATVRASGIARSNQELFEGVNAIAVGIREGVGGRTIALGLSFPVFAVSEDGDQPMIEALSGCARELGERVGDQRWNLS